MNHQRPLLIVLALPLLAAASNQGARLPAGDFAEGAISYLVSKRCERSPKLDATSVDWSALVYAAGKPPSWGRKPAGACRGLDTWVLSESLGAGAYWVQEDHRAIEADPMNTLFDDAKGHVAFKKTFGWELPERGDYVPPANVFLRFDPKKVSALFDRVYVKPTENVGLITGQAVYDHFFKGFVTRFAREVAFVQASVSRPELAKMTKAYQAAAKQAGAKFDGLGYLRQTASNALAKDPEQAARAGRTLGTILRRTADGTWPTLDRLLRKVIADYDPTLSEELRKTL